jgi:hypothetical protein
LGNGVLRRTPLNPRARGWSESTLARHLLTLPPALAPAHNGRVLIPTFREVQDDITGMLRQQGYLAAVLVDLSPLAHIEKSFGGAAFRSLREQVDPLMQSMRERFRQDDFVTRDEREGDRFLLFLSGPRRGDTPFRSETLRKLVGRVEVPEPACGPADAAVPQGAAGAGRRLRRRAVEPAREPGAADPAAGGRRRGLRADARADPRA